MSAAIQPLRALGDLNRLSDKEIENAILAQMPKGTYDHASVERVEKYNFGLDTPLPARRIRLQRCSVWGTLEVLRAFFMGIFANVQHEIRRYGLEDKNEENNDTLIAEYLLEGNKSEAGKKVIESAYFTSRTVEIILGDNPDFVAFEWGDKKKAILTAHKVGYCIKQFFKR